MRAHGRGTRRGISIGFVLVVTLGLLGMAVERTSAAASEPTTTAPVAVTTVPQVGCVDGVVATLTQPWPSAPT